MAIVYNSLFSPNSISLPSIKPNTKTPSLNPNLLSIPISHNTQKRNLPLPSVASIPYPPINVDYLESEFSGHGVSFRGIGERCVVRLGLENGSVATLMLPSGMITSYKAPMWHGGLLELLHTLVSEGEEGSGAVIQGGVSLALKFQSNGGESWSPSNWALHDVRGNPQESIQVELISTNSEDMVEVKHIVTLQEDVISSEIVIKNSKDSSLSFMGTVMSHLAVSTPEATYAVGLQSSNFFNRPPVLSNFTIIPPNFSLRDYSGAKKLWGPLAFKEFFVGWGSNAQNNAEGEEGKDGEELEGEEEDDYKHLTEKISRIYTCAPQSFTVMDRGRRNSVEIGRDGFKEMYMFSPGSTYEWYSKYAYICIGQSAMLEPIILAPKGEWRGGQHLHNPNM